MSDEPEPSLPLSDWPRARLLEALRLMRRARRFEEAAAQMFGMGLIADDLRLSIGQEAVAAGLRLACAPGDRMVAGLRCLAHAVCAEVETPALAAELAGRHGGLSDGRGAGRLWAPSVGFFGGAPGGSAVAEAAGMALAARAGGFAVLAVVDDLDAERGATLDALRLAQREGLALILCVEDARDPQGQAHDALRMAALVGVPGARVDGQDVAAVAAAAGRARARAGPSVLVLDTLRYRGHSMRDPSAGRARGEARRPRAGDDPIGRVTARLESLGVDEEALEAVDARALAQAATAAEFAETAPRARAA